VSSNLDQIPTAADLFRRVGADAILALLRNLGFWVGERNGTEQKAFRTEVSKLTSDQLGDESAYWQSELSRAQEVVGALRGRRHEVDLALRRARTAGLNQVLAGLGEGAKTPTKAVLDAKVDALPAVVDAEDAKVTLDTAITTMEGVVTAFDGYTRVLSREISRRGDQIRGRM
jgi:hypothetical protein